jgi:hypothetical protein
MLGQSSGEIGKSDAERQTEADVADRARLGMECGRGRVGARSRSHGRRRVLCVVVGDGKRITKTTWGAAGWIGLGPLVNV